MWVGVEGGGEGVIAPAKDIVIITRVVVLVAVTFAKVQVVEYFVCIYIHGTFTEYRSCPFCHSVPKKKHFPFDWLYDFQQNYHRSGHLKYEFSENYIFWQKPIRSSGVGLRKIDIVNGGNEKLFLL